MNKDNLKKEFHYFVLTDYEYEEAYLRDMHKNGFRLKKVSLPGFYYFEQCEPEDVIYKLDFNPQSKSERQAYLQMYQDYGWEYLQDMNDYSYFRKKASTAEHEKDLEIFSDDESKMEMLKKIFMKRMLPIFVIFLLCVVSQIVKLIFPLAHCQLQDGWDVGLLCFLIVVFVLYVYIIGRCGIGFWRLRKKYNRE